MSYLVMIDHETTANRRDTLADAIEVARQIAHTEPLRCDVSVYREAGEDIEHVQTLRTIDESPTDPAALAIFQRLQARAA